MIDITFFGVYLLLLIPIAWFAKKQRQEDSLHDFYLAGGNLGIWVLFFTLFSTQYSGNTFMAFPGKAYRMGYPYVMSITFMMAMIGGYLLYAPALRKVAKQKRFVTPADWVQERYQNKTLTLLVAAIMVLALMNYLLAQLMAMGHAVAGLSDGRIPYQAGVLFLAVVIVLYETIGGMRSVAWTDTLQGFLMVVATLILGIYFFSHLDKDLGEKILEMAPHKIQPPSLQTCLTWGSAIFIVGLGGAMYPQGIQRIYAAKSDRVLKQSFILMVFMPLGLVFFSIMMGIAAIVKFPGLGSIESDHVMTQMLASIASESFALHVVVSILLLGAVAAMMSTADSVLLSLSSMITKDFYQKTWGQMVSEKALLAYGKKVSWGIIFILSLLALSPEITLWRLLEIKFEILVQVAPLFILGLYSPCLSAKIAFLGLIVGCLISLGGTFLGYPKWHGIHIGTLGCIVNFVICLWGINWLPVFRKKKESSY